MSPVIQIDDVSFAFPFSPPVLDHIDLEVTEGEFVGLVGPNGGGKTTLLKIILGLLKPSAGRIRVLGKPPEEGRSEIGYVPQFATFPRNFPISVRDTVLMGRLGKTRPIFGYTRADKTAAEAVMRRAHIQHLGDAPIEALSGGHLQRVLVARALVCEPRILILDEPTANIDLRGEEDIFDLLKEMHRQLTIVLVSHDISFISQYVNRVACLNRTLICHGTEVITGEVIERLYGEPVHIIHHTHE